MSITIDSLVQAAKQLAQNGTGGGTGLQLLMTDPDDYQLCVTQALPIFQQDRQNQRLIDFVPVARGFRFTLSGGGTVIPNTNPLDAWVQGGSYIRGIIFPWNAADVGLSLMDENSWRQTVVPGSSGPVDVVEFMGDQPDPTETVRLIYVVPHTVGKTVALTSILPADVEAAKCLVASIVLQSAAVKAVQNTGTTGLPNDIVDRRTQSDQFKTQAKALYDAYRRMVGAGDDTTAASGTKDLDVPASFRRPFLWHPNMSH